MTGILDFKQPVAVIAGYWNAAILGEAGWLTDHLLGMPEGMDVPIHRVVAEGETSGGQVVEKRIVLFDKFGLCCSGQRLELFTRDMADLKQIYDVVAGISKNLPHTPVGGVGVNFHFQISDGLPAVTPRFDTREAFDAIGITRYQERVDAIEIADETPAKTSGEEGQRTVLSLTRRTDYNAVEVAFNYHASLPSISALSRWAEAKPIARWRKHACEVMSECYNVDEFSEQYH